MKCRCISYFYRRQSCLISEKINSRDSTPKWNSGFLFKIIIYICVCVCVCVWVCPNCVVLLFWGFWMCVQLKAFSIAKHWQSWTIRERSCHKIPGLLFVISRCVNILILSGHFTPACTPMNIIPHYHILANDMASPLQLPLQHKRIFWNLPSLVLLLRCTVQWRLISI